MILSLIVRLKIKQEKMPLSKFLVSLLKAFLFQNFAEDQDKTNLNQNVFTEIARQREQYLTPPAWELKILDK